MSPSEKGRLTVTSPGAIIEVLDAYLRPVEKARAADSLSVRLEPGAYRVVAALGGARETRTVVLSADGALTLDMPVTLDSTAPLPETRTADGSEAELLDRVTGRGPAAPGHARLAVVMRSRRALQGADADAPEIVDAAGSPVAVPQPEREDRTPSRALAWTWELPQGGYRLRWARADAEHAVWLAPGLQTVVVVARTASGPSLAGASVQLIPDGVPFGDASTGSVEVERLVSQLLAGRLRQRDLSTWLDADAPLMAQLLAATRLLNRPPHDWDAAVRRRLTRTVDRLTRDLAGMPDVEALRAGQTGETAEPVAFPPMLSSSLDLLLRADRDHEDVIPPESLSEDVSTTRYATRPWLIWRPVDDAPPATSGSGAAGGTVGIRGLLAVRTASPQPTGRSATVSESASERVAAVVDPLAERLGRSQSEVAKELGPGEIARRAGISRGLAERAVQSLLR